MKKFISGFLVFSLAHIVVNIVMSFSGLPEENIYFLSGTVWGFHTVVATIDIIVAFIITISLIYSTRKGKINEKN